MIAKFLTLLGSDYLILNKNTIFTGLINLFTQFYSLNNNKYIVSHNWLKFNGFVKCFKFCISYISSD